MQEESSQEKRISLLNELHRKALAQEYQIDDQLTEAIGAGDMKSVHALTEWLLDQSFLKQLPRRSTERTLTAAKNRLIVCNTYSRLAAKTGGLMPLFQYLIFEQYQNVIQNAPNIQYLNRHVLSKMFIDYGTAVDQFSVTTYSEAMKEIVTYITENLTNDLSLTRVASLFGMHPVHLARKFKQETGDTFINYVNAQRIYLAKYYFNQDMRKLSQVANLSGFNSHSYFTKVFKKITNETPTDYIKQIPEK
ncbi:helix-turn-helix domain-containing protein [Lacticigenium naphthae]|uniref:helix-turn-helix domain-containing protein n=1 Tax=Lacticigenium naphthae TaxID=515351 RepID=UPI000405AA8B|nr:AraC family transcriptional regulator [Lacticigenium naphthae]